jgi:hypothetical protein
MAEPPRPKRLALDTSVLIDLAAGESFTKSFVEKYQASGYDLRVPAGKRRECGSVSGSEGVWLALSLSNILTTPFSAFFRSRSLASGYRSKRWWTFLLFGHRRFGLMKNYASFTLLADEAFLGLRNLGRWPS